MRLVHTAKHGVISAAGIKKSSKDRTWGVYGFVDTCVLENAKIQQRQENSIKVGRRIDFRTSGYVDQFAKGAIEIRLNAKCDRDSGFTLRRNWDPVNNKLNMKHNQAERALDFTHKHS
jgi:hypothetical protein